MSEPFLGEIKIMSFNFPPRGWAFCNGQLLPINQNQALFALLGTRYGGNGQTTFALPNLRGRVPMHRGNGHTIGEAGGSEAHTLSRNEMPAHHHVVNAANHVPATNQPSESVSLGTSIGANMYASAATNLVAFAPAAITAVGGSQPHENRQPFTVLNFCIALQGIFPSQS